MSSSKSKDPLLQVVKEIEDYCQTHEIIFCYGFLGSEDQRIVYWDVKHDPDWRNFLLLAKSLQAKVIYFNLCTFEESELKEALSESAENAVADIESFSDKVGLLSCIKLIFIYDGVFHICEMENDWFAKFKKVVADIESLEEEEEEDYEIDEAVVDEWAKKLANDPRYSTCKNKTQRSYLLEQLAGKKYEDLPDWEILDCADKIYFLEVKANEDQRLKTEAIRLRDEGVNLNAIAQKLGISRTKVSGLLKN